MSTITDVTGRSKRPYLVRALYEWILDSQHTPYLLVRVDSDAVRVPEEYVNGGRIVLNVSPLAVRDLSLGNEEVTFNGRFAGRRFWVRVPMRNVLAVYAKESGDGMLFETQASTEVSAEGQSVDGDLPVARKRDPGAHGSHLKVIK